MIEPELLAASESAFQEFGRKYRGQQQNSIDELMADQVKVQIQGRAVRLLCEGGDGCIGGAASV